MTSLRRTTTLVLTLFAIAAMAAGCGSSSSSGGGGGGGGVSPAATPSVNNAVDQCLKDAKTLPQADARKTAEAACNAAKSGDVSKVKSAAKQQCLNAVKQIPDSAKQQKQAAQQRCNAIK